MGREKNVYIIIFKINYVHKIRLTFTLEIHFKIHIHTKELNISVIIDIF